MANFEKNYIGDGLLRSLLFVPGNRPDRIEKALNSSADMVIIDLEDAVPVNEKEAVREDIKTRLPILPGHRIIVRVNALCTGITEKDLSDVVCSNLSAIILPKTEDAEDVEEIDSILHSIERKRNLDVGKIGVLFLVESAAGVENAFKIASANLFTDRPRILAFGAADFALDMGITLTKSGDELSFPRARIAVACCAAGLPAPIDTPFMLDLKDNEAFKSDIMRAKKYGYGGKLCVHPNQVDPCNQQFSPTAAEIKFAEMVLIAFEAAKTRGEGVIQLEGKMIDKPIVEQAQYTIEKAKKIGIYP